ncbi:MAG: glycerate 2-kinase [Thermoplasmata archaeon]|nr:glycerate 2-kinase [Thermoplasmata archaeon]
MDDVHAPLGDGSPLAEAALEAYLAGVAAVDPTVLVRGAVRQGLLDDWLVSRERPHALQVLALGKAAPRMLWGLVETAVPFFGLGVAPRGVPAPTVDTFRWLPGDHPVPAAASFAAGQAVLDWAAALPNDAPVLVLLSGGASACAEAPADGWAPAEVAALHTLLLASGKPIEAVNRERAAASRLKAGGLGRALLARTPRVRVWLLADTDPAHAQAAVGSGPCDAPGVPHRVLASASEAIVGAGLRLGALGWQAYRHAPRVEGDAAAAMEGFLAALDALPADRDVALVGGGEATVQVPPGAPPGGRCQHAALAAARGLAARGSEALVLCGATDGVDGAGAAGAWASARDWDEAAGTAALAHGAAQGYLAARGRLIPADPTGTNVNDLWIALRPGRRR